MIVQPVRYKSDTENVIANISLLLLSVIFNTWKQTKTYKRFFTFAVYNTIGHKWKIRLFI
jgi:hypothetical protein